MEEREGGRERPTQARVFQAFTQADASTTREYGGTGLGLSISRQFVELMKGKMKVKSAVNRGTVIGIKIPLKVSLEKKPSSYPVRRANIWSCSDQHYAMTSSHLAYLGIESIRTNNEFDFLRLIDGADINIVDLANLQECSDRGLHITSHHGKKGIVIAPFVGNSGLIDIGTWIQLTSPLTSRSLQEALPKAQSTTKQSSQNVGERCPEKQSPTANILVAEDVETNQKIAKEMLELLGCKVTLADNGEKAVEIFQRDNVDVIFMDCQMPVMDGYAATSKIREIESAQNLAHVPIIALTAGAGKDDKTRCRQYGMSDYLAKPFSISELQDCIEKHLNKKTIISSFEKEPRNLSTHTSQKHQMTPQDSDPESLESINSNAIANIREVENQTGNALLPSIYEGFQKQVHPKLNELQDNISDGNFESAFKTAHAIKSMSANIGAEKVRAISASIEQSAKSGHTDEFIIEYKKLMAAVAEFETDFEKTVLKNTFEN